MQQSLFKISLFFSLFLFSFSNVQAQTVGNASTEKLAQARQVIDGYFEQEGAPGAIVAVIANGEVIHTLRYGLANVELGVQVADSTVFEIGSISKQFVAAVVMMLVEEGRLALDLPIHSYIDEIPGEWLNVTIRQLLTHTSGIPDYEEIAGYDVYQHRLLPNAIIELAHSRPMDFKPGQGWRYSNTGYYLLSMIVERIEGRPLGEILEDRIFKPLGMSQTSMADSETVIPFRASGYWANRSGELINRPAMETSSTLGAGGLLSSVFDMAKWDAALYGNDLLTATSKSEMWSPVRLPNGKPTLWPWGDPAEYGFGWEVTSYRGSTLQAHSGQTAGFVAQYMRFPDQGYSIVAFVNRYDIGAWPPARAMADYVIPGLDPIN